MGVRVEFFGIPRQRAGVSVVDLELETPTSLAHVLRQLSELFPALEHECIVDGELVAGLVASLGGARFLRDSATELDGTTSLLILSADAGG